MAGNGSAERFVARLYGVAALAHLIGNPAVDFHPAVFGLQALQWMLAPAAAWLVVKPGRAPLVATAALVLVTALKDTFMCKLTVWKTLNRLQIMPWLQKRMSSW